MAFPDFRIHICIHTLVSNQRHFPPEERGALSTLDFIYNGTRKRLTLALVLYSRSVGVLCLVQITILYSKAADGRSVLLNDEP